MRKIKIKGVYKHFKGDSYIVEDIGYDSETLEELVIYRALYDDNRLWVRKKDDFNAIVNKNNQKYKFELQKIKSVRNNQ